MPCIEETPRDVDVALQILDIVTPRININDETNDGVVRETTQTDHLNKRLLKTFLERLNVMTDTMININNVEDENSQDFDD